MEFIISFLLIIVLLSWLIGRLLPYIFRWFIKKKFNIDSSAFDGGAGREKHYSKYKDVENENNFGKRTAEEEREGKVTRIVINEERDKIIDNDLGEYVDFEEVEVVKDV